MAKAQQGREEWLNAAVTKFRPYFSGHGYEIPKALRVSCGFPSVGALGSKSRRIGEAWCSRASKDKHFEIFISPTQDSAVKVLEILAHELVHVTVGLECGHKGMFPQCARKIGLEGKMTSTYATAPLQERLNAMVVKLGKYPHGSLDKMTNNRKKQTTRLIKAHCLTCTYTIRASMTWLLVGVPQCPNPEGTDQG